MQTSKTSDLLNAIDAIVRPDGVQPAAPATLKTTCLVTSETGVGISVTLTHPPRPGTPDAELQAEIRAQLRPLVEAYARTWDAVTPLIQEAINEEIQW